MKKSYGKNVERRNEKKDYSVEKMRVKELGKKY